jgi:hypothetical protein
MRTTLLNAQPEYRTHAMSLVRPRFRGVGRES